MFIVNSESQPFAIVTNNLYDAEWEFLQFAIRSSGNTILYWNNFEGMPSLDKGQILLINGFSESAINLIRDWSIDLSVVGRLSEVELQFLNTTDTISFWNLDKYSLKSCISYVGNRCIPDTSQKILLWTGSDRLNSLLLSLFRFYSISATNANSPELALYTLDEKDYDILVLYWDYNGMDILLLIRELRIIKNYKTNFPVIVGIKDFDKPNIFKDLSMGIRDFCPVLFNKEEVWSLFKNSLPIEEESPLVSLDLESPILKRKNPLEGGSITLEYLKENRILKSDNYASWNELEKMGFGRQFDWVKI
jgi:CheY-like chemotaxis protein